MRAWLAVLLLVLLVVPSTVAESKYRALDKFAHGDLVITLRFPDAPLWQVFDSIAKSTGNKITPKPGWPQTRVSIEWQKITIVEALTKLADEYHLDYELIAPDKLVVVFQK